VAQAPQPRSDAEHVAQSKRDYRGNDRARSHVDGGLARQGLLGGRLDLGDPGGLVAALDADAIASPVDGRCDGAGGAVFVALAGGVWSRMMSSVNVCVLP